MLEYIDHFDPEITATLFAPNLTDGNTGNYNVLINHLSKLEYILLKLNGLPGITSSN